MMKLVQGFLYVCGHGDVTNPLVGVPIDVETAIEGSSPVHGDSIDLLERLDEMVRRVFADILDTKIVEPQGRNRFLCWHASKGKRSERRMSSQTWQGGS